MKSISGNKTTNGTIEDVRKIWMGEKKGEEMTRKSYMKDYIDEIPLHMM